MCKLVKFGCLCSHCVAAITVDYFLLLDVLDNKYLQEGH